MTGNKVIACLAILVPLAAYTAFAGTVSFSDGTIPSDANVTIKENPGASTVSVTVGGVTYAATLPAGVLNENNTVYVVPGGPAYAPPSAVQPLAKSGAKSPNELSGIVFGGDNPLPQATVDLYNQNDLTKPPIATTTGSDGSYSFFTIVDGTYQLVVTPPAGSEFSRSTVKDIQVSGGHKTQNVVLLRQMWILSGYVYGPDGKTPPSNVPVPNVPIEWDDLSGISWGAATSDADGHYEISLVRGTYRAAINCTSQLSIPSPGTFLIDPASPNVTLTSNTQQDIVLPFVTLSGHIYAFVTGEPVSNAEVDLYSDHCTSSAVSDADGFYSMMLLDGVYTVDITSPPPLDSNTFDNIPVQGNTTRNFTVGPQHKLSGTVFASDGVTPVSGVGVTWDISSYGDFYNMTTDSYGRYEGYVSEGTYWARLEGWADTVSIPAPEYFRINRMDLQLAITADTQQNFTLPPVFQISGRALGNGIPIPQTLVSFDGGTGTADTLNYYCQSQQVATDGAGNYSTLVFPGVYSVYAYPPVETVFAAAQYNGISVFANLNYDVILHSAQSISGTVYGPDGATPASGVSVTIGWSGWWEVVCTTDSSGGYHALLSRNPIGTTGTLPIVLSGYASDLSIPAPDTFQMVPPEIDLADVMQQDFTLPFVAITGRTMGGGSPLGNVEISAQSDNSASNPSTFLSAISDTTSDASGNYSLVLVPGTCGVFATPPFLYQVKPFRTYACTWFEISVPQASYDLLLDPAWVISGTAYSVNHEPVSGLTVKWAGDAATPAWEGHTDADGQYAVALGPGTYVLSISASSGDLSIASPDELVVNHAVPDVVLTGGTTQDISLPFVTISGKTTDPNAWPVGGVAISAQNTDQEMFGCSSTAVSAPDGTYQLILWPGTYWEQITPPEGSGFYSAYLDSVDVSQSILQNIILGIGDMIVPIVISGPVVVEVTDGTAYIEWQTSEPATSVVRYGIGAPSGNTASVPGLTTVHGVLLTGLTPNTTYSAQPFSTDASGNGPVAGAVVSFTTWGHPPGQVPPLVVEGPVVTSITQNSAVVQWSTDIPADSAVLLGTAEPLTVVANTPTLTLSHSMSVTGLTPGTNYLVQVASTDAFGNGPVLSRVVSFFTRASADTAPPVILSGPIAIGISDSGATIIWKTDEPSTSGVSYNDGTAYGIAKDDTLVTDHAVYLAGLKPGTTYNYAVTSQDASGNGPTLSATQQFTTGTAPDTRPPRVLEGPLVEAHATYAFVRWTTDQLAAAEVRYGTSANPADWQSQVTVLALERSHNVMLGNLAPLTTYYFQTISTDSSGNTTLTDVKSSTTLALAEGIVLEITAGPTVIAKTDDLFAISWQTNVQADTVVLYGLGSALNQTIFGDASTQNHCVVLTDLQPAQEYSFIVSSTDHDGTTVSSTGTFTTTTNSQPDTTSPVIVAGPDVVSFDETMATIHWITDEVADARVEFALPDQPLTSSQGDTAMSTDHVVTLTDLDPATVYSFRVGSTDLSGNGPTWSNTATLTTAQAPDTTPPVIDPSPVAEDIMDASARITWGTDEYATSQVVFGLSLDALTQTAALQGLAVNHRVALTGLQPLTTYFFSVISIDQSGNQASSPVEQFTTGEAAAPSIITQPASQTVSVGQSATFTVEATGIPAPTYQWTVNGNPIPGASAANYTTPPVQLSDSGTVYACLVANGAGNLTSDPATLTVTPATSYTLNYLAGDGGTLDGLTPQVVNSGGSGTPATAIPDSCFVFVHWSDGSTANPRTDINVTANISVTAIFAPNTAELTLTLSISAGNGVLVATEPTPYSCGEVVHLTAVPDSGYELIAWSGTNNDALKTLANTVTMTSNRAVTVAFALIGGGPIEIATIEDLQKIGNDPAYPANRNYVVTNDIDASATATWNDGAGFAPLNPSEGFTLDGQGHVIFGLMINRPAEQSVGLFAFLDGEVRNLGLEGGSVLGGPGPVGGLVGENYGVIEQCYATCAVSGEYSYQSKVGGLVGVNLSNITHCYATGAVSGMYFVGGLVGYAQGTGTIADCYAAGAVTRGAFQGGLIGYNDYYGFLMDSYFDMQTSGTSNSAGGGSATTAEMMSQATFVNWDFQNIWDITEGATYPLLRVFGARYGVVLAANPVGSGTIKANPSGPLYIPGTLVTLIAAANEYYTFDHWSGDAAGIVDITANTATITMDGNKSLTANFVARQQFTLTVVADPDTWGWVYPPSDTYAAGTVVAVGATPAPGYIFWNWTGDVAGIVDVTSPTISVVMDQNRVLVATFMAPPQYGLAVMAAPSTAGTFDVVPLADTYVDGTVVSIVVTPTAGYTFVNWTGDVSGVADVTNPSISVVMDQDRLLTAHFMPLVTLTTMVINGHGTLNPQSGQYTANTVVNLYATPDAGFQVKAWTGTEDDTSTATSNLVDMTGDKTVTIEFEPISLGTLNGIVTLEGRPAKPDARWSIALDIVVTPPSPAAAYETTVTTDNNGAFALAGLTPGAYTCWIKGANTLAVSQSMNIAAGDNAVDFAALPEGDSNGDNKVTLVDFSILVGTFGKVTGQAGFDARADFNGDGSVTLVDFSMLVTHFGQVGAVKPVIAKNVSKAKALDKGLQPLVPAPAMISVVPEAAKAVIGQTFDVTIEAETGEQTIDGAAGCLEFDPAVLQVEGVQSTGKMPVPLTRKIDNEAGQIAFAAGAFSNLPSGTVPFVTVTFRAVSQSAGTTLTLANGDECETAITAKGVLLPGATRDGGVVVGTE